jgi:hypothetical protein
VSFTSLGENLDPPEQGHLGACPCTTGYICTRCRAAHTTNLRAFCGCGSEMTIEVADEDACQCEALSRCHYEEALERFGRI